MNEKFYITWNNEAGEARYLGGFQYGRDGLIYYDAYSYPDGALAYPEEVAAWLSQLLDDQDDLNPRMIRI